MKRHSLPKIYGNFRKTGARFPERSGSSQQPALRQIDSPPHDFSESMQHQRSPPAAAAAAAAS
jgi:hypothetical protein